MSRRLWRGAAFALAWLPALAGAWAVRHFAVEVPVWDDLERATLLDSWQRGTLDWGYLYSPHIEHRMVVPRLITLANASLGSGRLVVENGITFALALAAALGVHLLLRRTFPGRPATVWGATLLANLALLSTMQWETFLWAVQLAFVVPPLALLVCLLVMGGRLPLPAKGALCFLACLVATVSFSHGVLLWGVVFALALLQPRLAPPRARALFLGVWALASAAVLVPHFTVDHFRNRSEHGYVEVGQPAPGLELGTLSERVPRAVLFGEALLGSPLARLPGVVSADVAPPLGRIVAGVFGLCVLFALAHFREAELRERWLPWLAVGGFAFTACVLAAVGRSALNKWKIGLLPHYLEISTYLIVATAVLLVLLLEELVRRHPAVRAPLAPLPALGLGALVAVQLYQWGIGLDGMRAWRLARLHARTSILFLDFFEPDHWRRIDGIPDVGRRLLKRLDGTGFLHPPLLREPTLAAFETARAPLPASAARVQQAQRRAAQLVVSGYAWLPDAGRSADGVLLVARGRVVGLAETRGFPRLWLEPNDYLFDDLVLPGIEDESAWRGKVPLASLPDLPELRIDLYAVESDRMRVYPLPQHIVLRRPAGAPPEASIEGAAAEPQGPGAGKDVSPAAAPRDRMADPSEERAP